MFSLRILSVVFALVAGPVFAQGAPGDTPKAPIPAPVATVTPIPPVVPGGAPVPAAVSKSPVIESEATCPLCGQKIKLYEMKQFPRENGRDSDFASYEKGPSCKQFLVQTCVKCLYTDETEEFKTKSQAKDAGDSPIPADTAARLNEILLEERKTIKLVSQLELTPWKKFELGAKCCQALDAERLKVANAYLAAAWSVRRAICWRTLYANAGTPDKIISLIAKEEEELKENKFSRDSILIVLAVLNHRAGFTRSRDARLQELEKNPPKPEGFRKEFEQIKKLVALEKSYTQSALALYQEELKTRIEGSEEYTRDLYLIGDLQRRIGETQKAKECFNKLLELKDIPEDLQNLAKLLLDNIDK